MGSGHDHSSAAIAAPRRRLLWVLLISATILVVEVIGALRSGSLALLADAGHMLTDVAGVALALLAVTLAARKAGPERTFGYYRLEILAAVINAVLLFGVSIYLLFESWSRWTSPHEVDGGIVLIFAGIGVVANLVSFTILRGGAKDSLNVRGAYLEVVGDLLGSITVIIAAIIIMTTSWERADALASAVVALMMLPRTWSLLREAVDVLLEAAPKGMNVAELRAHILEVDGVIDAHDLHVWMITSGQPVMSAHVVVSDETLASGSARVLDELHECLAHHFDVSHCTFQIEGRGQAKREQVSHPQPPAYAGIPDCDGRRCGLDSIFMPQIRISDAAGLLGVSDDTVRRWVDSGRLAGGTDEAGRRTVDSAEVAALLSEASVDTDRPVPTSARNRFPGIVTRVERDGVMALVEVQSGPHRVVSLISREGADELGLEPGVIVAASVKSTNVVIERESR